MNFAMMSAAQGYREFVAHLCALVRGLRKAQVMSVGGRAAANQTRLLGDEFHVLPVAKAAWLGKWQKAFVDDRDFERAGPSLAARRCIRAPPLRTGNLNAAPPSP